MKKLAIRLLQISNPQVEKTMRSKIYALCLLFVLLMPGGRLLAVQKKEALRADWLALDVANIERLLPELKRNQPLTLPALEQIFGAPPSVTELGFGGRVFTFSKGGGYTSLRVRGFVFIDRIGYYTISIGCSSSWSMIRNVIVETWKRNTDLEFKEGECSLAHDREFPDVVADYKTTVASQLGELEPVTVPPELRGAYEHLISLGNNSRIGNGGCGYGGVTPEGKNAIDAIVRADRVDFINNILRGYNPGGRVYAWLALFGKLRKGQSVSADSLRAMDVVRTLNIELEHCSGCILSFETAQQIINDWEF